MKNRRISSINILSVREGVTPEDIEKIPFIKECIYYELINSIKDATRLKKDIATLFEINDSGYILELNKKEWVAALEKAKPYYEKLEDFEKCALIRDLITSTNESRNKQDSSSHKQYSRRKNTVKKEKSSKETANISKQEGV